MTVSLTSILSSYGYGTNTSTSKTDASAIVAAALEKLSEQTKAASASTASADGTQVSISPEALAAAAAKADNAKDFAALAKEVRASLDAQYSAGTAKGSADLSGLSGRALSAIALNKDGQFSNAEIRAAKLALREQTSSSFMSTGYGSGMSGVASFSQQLATQYDAMSPEERQARGWTEKFRDSNASFAAKAASASTASTPTLFDQI